jgi:hypothetical protein
MLSIWSPRRVLANCCWTCSRICVAMLSSLFVCPLA